VIGQVGSRPVGPPARIVVDPTPPEGRIRRRGSWGSWGSWGSRGSRGSWGRPAWRPGRRPARSCWSRSPRWWVRPGRVRRRTPRGRGPSTSCGRSLAPPPTT